TVGAAIWGEVACGAAESRCLPDRMAVAGVSHGVADPAKSDVCGSVCFWQDNSPHICGGRPCKKDRRSSPANAGMERVAARSSRGLHQLATVRGEPEDDSGERAHAKASVA